MRRHAAACQTIVYTRTDCGLCADADALLRRYGFRPTMVDIDTDLRLVRKYGESIPVVKINGKVRFRGNVNETLLLRLLRSPNA